MHRTYLIWGAGSALLAVALGAFGAHALKEQIPPDRMTIFQTGVQYQTVHALGLVTCALLWGQMLRRDLVAWTGRLFLFGTLVFSGSLYALALSGIKVFGAITPIGGASFLAGWLILTLAAIRQPAA